jgi:hypothetical protein
MNKIKWHLLSSNPNAIELLKENKNKIHWDLLSSNPNAIELLKENMNIFNEQPIYSMQLIFKELDDLNKNLKIKLEKHFDEKIKNEEQVIKEIKKEEEEVIKDIKKEEEVIKEIKNEEVIKEIKNEEVIKEIKKEEEEVIKEIKYKKRNIPIAVKISVWNKYIGEEIGKTKCLCCNDRFITQMQFHCGHIISEINGGKTNINNLKPICSTCNFSMGRKNMHEFAKEYFNS